MSAQPPLSETEHTILKVLWEEGAGTVREVLAALVSRGHTWAYTTVQTLLTRLSNKGYAQIERGPAHVYRAAVSRDELLQLKLSDLAETYCEGTTSPLVLALVEGAKFSARELAQFRELIDKLEAESNTPRRGKGGKP